MLEVGVLYEEVNRMDDIKIFGWIFLVLFLIVNPWILALAAIVIAGILFYCYKLPPQRYRHDICTALNKLYPDSDVKTYEDDRMSISVHVNDPYYHGGSHYKYSKCDVTLHDYPTVGESTTVLKFVGNSGKAEIYHPQGQEQWERYLLETLLPKVRQEARERKIAKRAEEKQALALRVQNEKDLERLNHSPLP